MNALPQPNFGRNVRLIGHSNQGGRALQSVSARVDAADLIDSIDNNAELPFRSAADNSQPCADVLARLELTYVGLEQLPGA
ncbi:MAG: hypothetical protein WA268_26180 [Xanthobacteraceae bacterium]